MLAGGKEGDQVDTWTWHDIPGAGEQTSHNQSMTGDSPTCLSHSEFENSGTLHFPQPQDASASAWCQAAKEDDPSGTRKASRK